MSSPPVAKKESGAKLIKIKASQGDMLPGSPPKLVITEPDQKKDPPQKEPKSKSSSKSKRLTLDLAKSNSEPIFDKSRIKERADQIHEENSKKSNTNNYKEDNNEDNTKELRRSKSISGISPLLDDVFSKIKHQQNDGSKTARGREDEDSDGIVYI